MGFSAPLVFGHGGSQGFECLKLQVVEVVNRLQVVQSETVVDNLNQVVHEDFLLPELEGTRFRVLVQGCCCLQSSQSNRLEQGGAADPGMQDLLLREMGMLGFDLLPALASRDLKFQRKQSFGGKGDSSMLGSLQVVYGFGSAG